MKRILVLVALVLLTAACGEDSDIGPGGAGHMDGGDHMDGGHMGGGGSTAAFGEPADESDADRTVEVTATELRFSPPELEVEEGETVTFEVTNDGQTAHEFVLGDESYQESHEDSMGGMGHGRDNGVFLDPGAGGSVTWTFTSAGEVLYACHVNGHYEAGMFGRIQVR